MGADSTDGVGTPEAAGGAPVHDASERLEREEVEPLRMQTAELRQQRPSGPASRHRIRQAIVAVLAVATVVTVISASAAVWLTRTAFDTERFMGLIEPVLESPEVTEVIGLRLTGQTLEALALQDRFDRVLTDVGRTLGDGIAEALGVPDERRARIRRLPIPQLEDLAAPIASGLESRIADRIDEAVTSPEFQRLLVDAAGLAHTKAVAFVRGDGAQLPNVVVAGDEVRLNLIPPLTRILAGLVDQGLDAVGIDEIPVIDPLADPQVSLDRLSAVLGTQMPPEFGQLTVLSTREMHSLQTLARRLDQLVWLLLVLSVLLLVATLAAAPRRRRVLVQLGLGTAVGAVSTTLLVRSTEEAIVASAVTAPGRRALAMLAGATFDSLRAVMIVVLVVSLLVALLAHLAGAPAWWTAAVRRTPWATVPQQASPTSGGASSGRLGQPAPFAEGRPEPPALKER
jgi:hypothetical protein